MRRCGGPGKPRRSQRRIGFAVPTEGVALARTARVRVMFDPSANGTWAGGGAYAPGGGAIRLMVLGAGSERGASMRGWRSRRSHGVPAGSLWLTSGTLNRRGASFAPTGAAAHPQARGRPTAGGGGGRVSLAVINAGRRFLGFHGNDQRPWRAQGPINNLSGLRGHHLQAAWPPIGRAGETVQGG